MKHLIALFLIHNFFSMHAFGQKQIVYDPAAEVRIVEGSYKSIVVTGASVVYFSQSANYSMAISAPSPQGRNAIKTRIENGVLYISASKGAESKSRVYISAPDVNKMIISGASNVTIAGTLTVSELSVTLTGASTLKGALQVDNLHLFASGASDAILNGTANRVNFTTSGASNVKAPQLATNVCVITASGASTAQLTILNEANLTLSGASKVEYTGEATMVTLNSSGASKVKKLEAKVAD